MASPGVGSNVVTNTRSTSASVDLGTHTRPRLIEQPVHAPGPIGGEVAVDTSLADIREREHLDSVFKRFTPDVVFHTAAHKHVPLLEENFEEASSNNVIGTRNLVEAAFRPSLLPRRVVEFWRRLRW